METSILTSTKKILGLDEDYTTFDSDIITHINTAFSILAQLGVGPVEGFMIEDAEAVWEDFLGTDSRYNMVKTYVWLKVRQLFDPPTTSYLITAFNEQVQELEWRINSYREETEWIDPDPDPDSISDDVFGDPVTIDGGGA